MKLSQKDLKLFYKLHPALILFTNKVKHIIQNVNDLHEFMELNIKDKVKIRNELYKDVNILNKFYEENPFNFTERELRIVLDWKYFINGKFFVYNQYKKYCAFIHDDDTSSKTYGVIGLTNTFGEMIEKFPILIETILLPFKNQIIWDGFYSAYNVYFGPGIRADLKERYEESKAKYGIIQQLPFNLPSKRDSNIGLLRYYLKSDSNMEYYNDEIEGILEENKDMIEIYHQEYGKRCFKKLKKRLIDVGISNGWFAVFDETIIASGKTEEKVKEIVEDLKPNEKLGYITYFKIN